MEGPGTRYASLGRRLAAVTLLAAENGGTGNACGSSRLMAGHMQLLHAARRAGLHRQCLFGGLRIGLYEPVSWWAGWGSGRGGSRAGVGRLFVWAGGGMH